MKLYSNKYEIQTFASRLANDAMERAKTTEDILDEINKLQADIEEEDAFSIYDDVNEPQKLAISYLRAEYYNRVYNI